MKKFISRIEKILLRVAIGCILLIAIVQGLMTADPLRFYLSWSERRDGQSVQIPVTAGLLTEPVEEAVIVLSQARLAIEAEKFSALPHAKILVNGQEKYNFSDKKVIFDINAGDTVKIDSTAYNFPISYKIVEVSDNLAFPEQEQIFTANQTVVMIGKIIVK